MDNATIPGEWMLRTNDLDSLADWFKIHSSSVTPAQHTSAVAPCVWCATPTQRWDWGNPDCGCF